MKSDSPQQLLLFQRLQMIPIGGGEFKVVRTGPPEEWLWIADAARVTGLARNTIRHLAANGHIKARRMGRRKYQVYAADLQKYLEPYNHLK
jgi:excisionase family DNA binding protein